MNQLHTPRRLPGCLAVGAAVACLVAALGPAEAPPKPAAGQAVYDRDPRHLWNRLDEALLVRVGPDRRTYGRDRFEPLLWLGSRHLLEGASHDRAVELLDQFLREDGERLTEDPLRRALLQRDLWMLFSWLEGMHSFGGGSGLPPAKLAAAQRRLGRPLAAVIRRLALRPEQVKALPDNYAAAVKSTGLPRDLFSPGGPWVCVGRADGPVARMHVQEANTLVNSAFLIFLRLPPARPFSRSPRLRTPAGGVCCRGDGGCRQVEAAASRLEGFAQAFGGVALRDRGPNPDERVDTKRGAHACFCPQLP